MEFRLVKKIKWLVDDLEETPTWNPRLTKIATFLPKLSEIRLTKRLPTSIPVR